MPKAIEALFDGVVLRPDEPLALQPNTRVRIVIEEILPVSNEAISFLKVARSIKLEGPSDWSSNLDHYLYDEQTRNEG